MSEHGNERRAYKDLSRDLLHPPFRDRRFWLIQMMVVVIFLIHLVFGLTRNIDVFHTPGFIWTVLLFIPLIYSGAAFGFRGTLAVAVEACVLFIPDGIFFPHTALGLWAEWSILFVILVSAFLLGYCFEKERELHDHLLVTERLQTASYYESHPLFGEHLLSKLHDGMVLVSEDGIIHYANGCFVDLSGYSSKELVGMSVEKLVPLNCRSVITDCEMDFVGKSQHRVAKTMTDLVLLRKDGVTALVDLAFTIYYDENKPWIIAMVRDVSVRRSTLSAQAELEQRFQIAFVNNIAGMAITDLSMRILSVNQSFCIIVGRSQDELIGSTSAFITFADDRGVSEDSGAQMIEGGIPSAVYTKRYTHKDGSIRWVEVSQSLAFDDGGLPQYFIYSVRDITEERMLIDELSYLAHHDPLTGVANRVFFDECLSEALAKTTKKETLLGVFLIDLDEFKEINDTFGHQVGDDLLVEVARRLERITSQRGILCRFGGDEFLYLDYVITDPAQADEVAEQLLGVFEERFSVAGEQIVQSATIGFVTCTDAKNSSDLLRDADTALYHAKNDDKGNFAVFRSEMHDRVSNRFGLMQELRRSLEAGEISMHYQPIVDLNTREIVGVEALMRWNHPEHGWISPDIFIPLAEQGGLIYDLGSFALSQAIADAASWRDKDDQMSQHYLAVNLSPRQFHEPKLFEKITEALEENAFSPSRLVLEITEGAAFEDINSAIRVVGRLRDFGVSLAIDDFGTGFSALNYFSILRPRFLKVDKSFVYQAGKNSDGERLLNAMSTIGESLGAKVVAEGVETISQVDMLLRLGYSYGQGYLFSPAVPSTELGDVLVRLTTSNVSPPPPPRKCEGVDQPRHGALSGQQRQGRYCILGKCKASTKKATKTFSW